MQGCCCEKKGTIDADDTFKLSVNVTKTEFTLIGSRQNLNIPSASPTLTVNGSNINQVTTTKSLGILIDANLTMGSHIDKLAKKNCLRHCFYLTGQTICPITNITYYLQSLNSNAFRLL